MNLEIVLKKKKLSGFSWDQMADALPITGDALRMAFKRKKVDTIYLEVIEKELDSALASSKEHFEHNKQIELTQVKEPSEVFTTKSGNRFEELPNGKYMLYTKLVGVKAQASYVSAYQDAEFIDDLTEVSWILDRVVKGSYRAFEIMNDSMNDGSLNSVPDGSYVLGRELGKHLWKDGLRYKQYDKWIIVHRDTVMCKQIIDHNIEEGTITLHSFNTSPEYQDFTISLNEVNQLYNIVKRQID